MDKAFKTIDKSNAKFVSKAQQTQNYFSDLRSEKSRNISPKITVNIENVSKESLHSQ